jgi:hypothetical protein
MRRKNKPHKDELDGVAQRLRSERPEPSPLELDRIKTTAMSRLRPARGRAGARRRLVVAGLTIGLMAAGTGGVIAGGATSSNPSNAATAQYGPAQGGGVLGSKHHKKPMSHWHIKIHLNVPHRSTLNRVTVVVNGKVLFVLKNHRVSSTIDVGYLPCGNGPTTIEVIAIESDGAIIRESRQLHLCQSASSTRDSRKRKS